MDRLEFIKFLFFPFCPHYCTSTRYRILLLTFCFSIMIDYSVVFIHFNFLSPFKSSFWNIVLALVVDLSLSFILYFFLSLFISLSQTHKHTLSFSSGIVTTALTAYGENFAMKFLSASESTVIYSTEPLWGTAFAGTFYSTV